MTEAEEAQCWQALRRATWSRAVAWRRQLDAFDQLLAVGQTPDSITAFLLRDMPPVLIVDAVEELIKEGHLRRSQAARIEERILERVRADGLWA